MMKMSPYAKYHNGKLVLLLIGLVTAVDLILILLSTNIKFPCSVFFSQWILKQGINTDFPFLLGLLLSVFSTLYYLLLWLLTLSKEIVKIQPMRIACITYFLDSIFYLIISVSEITSSGISLSHIIEIVFRIFCVVTMYMAAKVYFHPERDVPDSAPAEKEEQEETPPASDDHDDEGIQW